MTSGITKTTKVKEASDPKVLEMVIRVRDQGINSNLKGMSHQDKRSSLYTRDMVVETLISMYMLKGFVSDIDN